MVRGRRLIIWSDRSLPMTFNIRFDAPWPTVHEPEYNDPRLVGQNDRTWMFPLIHSTLANCNGRHSWPRYDKVTELTDACAYWEGAYYLLAVLLGWSDIGLGLKRLYQGERPSVESPQLDLLEQVWNDRQQLDHFALWAWHRRVVVRGEGPPERQPEEFVDRDWYRDFLTRHPGPGISYDHDPYHGGTNPLHLGHCLGAMEGHADGRLLQSSTADRRATLILDHARGWYSALEPLLAPGLPRLSPSSSRSTSAEAQPGPTTRTRST